MLRCWLFIFLCFLMCVCFHIFSGQCPEEITNKKSIFYSFFLKLTISNVESQVQWKNSICIFSLSTPYHRLVLFLSYSVIIFINIFFVLGLCFRKRGWCIRNRTSPIFNAPPSYMNFSLINTTNFFLNNIFVQKTTLEIVSLYCRYFLHPTYLIL